MQLILASTSSHRRHLLARLGIPFRCVAPQVDEDEWKDRGLSPVEVAEQLARAKSLSVCQLEPDAVILGSDQLVACEGTILGKPGTVEGAIQQLMALSGRTHELVTAVFICREGHTWAHTDVARLTMRPLSSDEIERYVRADSPLDCAGSYQLEQRGIALFESIVCSDHTAITGLPLMAVTSLLREIGFPVP